ncbi:MAG TPA: hypothetical protein VE871_12880 [Longimicrobium sp.]|nr:hypothetical protein [Longimicrobium sp.]
MMNNIKASEAPRFALCICNDGYPAALELHKAYPMLPDAVGERYGMVRIVDESGEGYLYPQEFFQPIEVPQGIGELLLRAS